MSLKFSISMATAAASLSLAGQMWAVTANTTYTEVGDAGQLPSSAQVVSGPASTNLSSISGTTNLTNNIADGDMYEIYINSPSTFSASDTAFISGSNNFDSQLFLFTSTGAGVLANDDASSGEQSDLPAGSLTLGAGVYYLLINGSGNYPIDTNSAVMFPNYTDSASDATTGVYGPNSGITTIAGYTGNSDEAGKYVIALTGAEFIASDVPEPSTFAFVLAGAAGTLLRFRVRRRAAR